MANVSKVIPPEVLKKLEELIKEIKFGSVTIVIQDSHIVQIEMNEKLRFK